MPLPPADRGVRDREPRRAAVRRTWNAALDWIDDHDLTSALSSLAFLFVCGGIFLLIVIVAGGDAPPRVAPAPPRPAPEAPEPDGGTHVNAAGGYAIMVPASWERHDTGARTRIEHPGGRVSITFGPGPPGDAELASARLVDAFLAGDTRSELVGRGWERIDDVRSLMVSGRMVGEDGRAVRFVAITIPARDGNYAITITVPAGSDPARLLPRLEEIVSSFRILAPAAEAI